MNRDEFAALAKKVVEAKGRVGRFGHHYEDDLMEIRTNYNGLDLQVTRKAMPHISQDLRGENPTTMVKDGEVIRHHGEAAYLDSHLLQLAEGI